MTYKVYTDGGSRGNPGVGGWAFVVYQGWSEKGHKSGAFAKTTNNIAELTAIVEALQWAIRAKLSHIEILTDSNYAVQGYKTWMHGWVKKGWKTAGGTPVKNLELWQTLYNISSQIDVTMTKVKGHSGIEGNERADALCNCAMDEWELENVVMK
ncbi:Rnase H [Vibrio phage Thalassa]|uniref:ribonuclease H n=1 Tax=Vibrio phage Thalassa TaxID=2570301 RepID=A0A2H5BH17_9CAUD|nr:Rnase H [Vibrio phage Thalassa]AUG85287.1 ribonuclease H [Vibrio phage Thalassa]